MSTKNKATDRDATGAIRQRFKSKHCRFKLEPGPSWFRRDTSTVPRRREELRLATLIKHGADPESLLWPHNSKPKEYWS